MATHCSILAWKIPWTEEPDRLQSRGSQRVGHNCDRACRHASLGYLEPRGMIFRRKSLKRGNLCVCGVIKSEKETNSNWKKKNKICSTALEGGEGTSTKMESEFRGTKENLPLLLKCRIFTKSKPPEEKSVAHLPRSAVWREQATGDTCCLYSSSFLLWTESSLL